MAKTRNTGNLSDLLTAGTQYVTTATPPTGDSSQNLATTAFVQASMGNFSSRIALNSATTLTTSQSGSFIEMSGLSAYTVTLPAPTGGNLRYTFYNASSITNTITTPSGAIFNELAAAASISIPNGGSYDIVSDGNNWIVLSGGSAGNIATSGYQKMTSGLIFQWGTWTSSASGYSTWTFPIAFPTAAFYVSATNLTNGTGAMVLNWNQSASTKSGASVAAILPGNGAYTAVSLTMFAIGN